MKFFDFFYNLFPWVKESGNGFVMDFGLWDVIKRILQLVIRINGSDVVIK